MPFAHHTESPDGHFPVVTRFDSTPFVFIANLRGDAACRDRSVDRHLESRIGEDVIPILAQVGTRGLFRMKIGWKKKNLHGRLENYMHVQMLSTLPVPVRSLSLVNAGCM